MINKRKVITITIIAILLRFLFCFLIVSLALLPYYGVHRFGPLNDKKWTIKKGKVMHGDLDYSKIFYFDSCTISVKEISEKQYLDNDFVNCFFDLNYDLYYQISIVFLKDKVVKTADVYVTKELRGYAKDWLRPKYVFSLKIDNIMYEDIFFIQNFGLIKPTCGFYYD